MHAVTIFGILFAGSLQIFAFEAKFDYCSRQLCGGSKHIACKNSGTFHSSCPANAELLNLQAHQARILSLHNERRNQLASGKLPGFVPVKRMCSMQWNKELAELAELNVMRCSMQHDECHNTHRFSHSGQNLFSFAYMGVVSYSSSDLLEKGIDSWWKEYKNTNMLHISSYPVHHTVPMIGHFTVMAWDRNTHVGCAAVRFSKNGWHQFLMACNYAYTNMIGEPVYLAGKTASSCTSGVNSNYNGLCSVNEIY